MLQQIDVWAGLWQVKKISDIVWVKIQPLVSFLYIFANSQN
jgi:hypothetical protein